MAMPSFYLLTSLTLTLTLGDCELQRAHSCNSRGVKMHLSFRISPGCHQLLLFPILSPCRLLCDFLFSHLNSLFLLPSVYNYACWPPSLKKPSPVCPLHCDWLSASPSLLLKVQWASNLTPMSPELFNSPPFLSWVTTLPSEWAVM